MIRSMPTTGRPQQRYDHRLRNLVHRTGDVTVATDLGVPRSTARGGLSAAPTVVVCLDVADLRSRSSDGQDPETLLYMAKTVRDGNLTIPISQQLPLREARQGHIAVERGAGGKILLLP